jgi:hydrogenase maturation protease
MTVKLIGLGHYMRGDDEIGLILVERWKEEYADQFQDQQIEVEILESPGVNLLGTIAGLDAAVLVDAVQSGAPAGRVIKFTEDDLEVFGDGSGSVHGWGAAETLSLGRQLIPEDMPETVILIGVESLVFELGEGLSPAVKSVIPKALAVINEVLGELFE